MSEPGGEPHPEPRDPFRSDGRPPAAPSSEHDRRTAIRLAVLSVAAVGSAFFAPPVGAVLGVVAIVIAVRSRTAVPARPRALAVISGSIAIVVGVAITGTVLVFWSEITEHRRCLQGANTVQAQQNCQDTLSESLSARLGR